MLTKDEFEALPEKARAAFVLDGEEYIPAKDGKLKQTLNDVDSKYKSAMSELEEFKRKQAEQIAAAEAAALEKLKKEGKVDELLADVERRNGETVKQFNERIERLTNQIKTEKRSAILSELAGEMATDKGAKVFKKLIESRIEVDAETGKVTFLNDDGSASSLDLAGFKAELLKDESLEPVLKANVVTSGGGMANGSSGGSAPVASGNVGGTRAEREAAFAKKFKLPLT